jgi:hypothetical protein
MLSSTHSYVPLGTVKESYERYELVVGSRYCCSEGITQCAQLESNGSVTYAYIVLKIHISYFVDLK